MQDDEKKQMLFIQLVMTFQAAAWQHMGKIKNPLTDKIERSLIQARFDIDMLDMLRSRTQGNLTAEEKKLIDSAISELQLNYVAEVEAEKKAKPVEPESGGDGKSDTAGSEPPSESPEVEKS
jgi:hypothetical protein